MKLFNPTMTQIFVAKAQSTKIISGIISPPTSAIFDYNIKSKDFKEVINNDRQD